MPTAAEYSNCFLLLNPRAGGGRGRRSHKRWLSALESGLPGLRWAYTAGPGHETESQVINLLVTEPEVTVLIGAGGDGTHHWVVNGMRGHFHRVSYAPLPLGSGNDWCRGLGVARRPRAWVTRFRQQQRVSHLLGEIVNGADRRSRLFVNVAGWAFDPVVALRAAAARRRYRWMYPYYTIAGLRSFEPPRIRLTYDGTVVEDEFHTINVGIGRYSGGGMRLVPQADYRGDHFALTFARRLPVARIVAQSWRFYTGHIGGLAGVTTTHARELSLDVLSGPADGEADGEWAGRGRFSVRPGGRLSVVA